MKKYGRDRHIRDRLLREVFGYRKQSPGLYLQCLDDFLRIAEYICPKKESFLARPTIRHPDLNPNNVFVSRSFDILSLIDWQHCAALPLFLQCGIPEYLQNYGDGVSESLVKPGLPKNMAVLDQRQQEAENEIFQKRLSHYCYMAATVEYNDSHFDALWEDPMMFRKRLFAHASSPWEGDNVTLKIDLIEATKNWSDIVTATAGDGVQPCPLSYPQTEVEECLRLGREIQEVDERFRVSTEYLGVGAEGWVPTERFEASKALEAEVKERALDFAESDFERQMLETHWPFDDQDEQE